MTDQEIIPRAAVEHMERAIKESAVHSNVSVPAVVPLIVWTTAMIMAEFVNPEELAHTPGLRDKMVGIAQNMLGDMVGVHLDQVIAEQRRSEACN